MKKLRIAMIQQNPIVGDIKGNLSLAIKSIAEAKQNQADVLLFSELFITGYPLQDLVLKYSLVKEAEHAIEKLLEHSYNVCIIIGAPSLDNGKIYNAAYCLSDGKLIGKSYKRDLPNYDEFDEKRVFEKGNKLPLISWKKYKFGIPICEDVWNDPDICMQLAEAGADLILVPNASPYRSGKILQRIELIKNRAKKPIIYVNQVGGQDELIFDGGSFAYDKELIYIAKQFKSEIAYIDFESALKAVKKSNPILDNKAADYTACILGLRDYIQKNGFKKAILGLSGGLDSALCAVMIADAIGANNMQCYMLPYIYTSEQSIVDAKEVAKNIDCQFDIINITNSVEALSNSLNSVIKDKQGLWFENLQSRIRGVILMALSNKNNSLLITTGNKSEMAVGYATLYGDMNGAYNPIKDIYKSYAYELANWRNNNILDIFLCQKKNLIGSSILTKPASAELRKNQKDEDSLLPYDILDNILFGLVEKNLTAEEIAPGDEQAANIERLLYRAEYKRSQAPIGARISSKNFGIDRRYPITNKFK